MNAETMWQCYCESTGVTAEYDAWCFGDDADTLAQLVLAGTKTATSSAHVFYELEEEPLPEPGQYSVVLDSRDEAVCVIRTDSVRILPYCQVDERFAFLEGEGDRTLSYWRRVHKAFFTQEMEGINRAFSEDMLLVLEEFTCVYPVADKDNS